MRDVLILKISVRSSRRSDSERNRTRSCSSVEKRMVPRDGIIRNHRRDEPLFVLSMVA